MSRSAPYFSPGRCQACFQQRKFCLCGEINKISIATKITVLMHSLEQHKSTNTVRLLKLAVPETEIELFGKLGSKPVVHIPPEVTPLVLFPYQSAPILDREFCNSLSGPVMLIVPDGTWTQARKLIQNHSDFHGVPRVRVVSTKSSRYRLRKSDVEGALCTLEAIALALGALEGEAVQRELERLLDLMVEGMVATGHNAKPAEAVEI